MKPFLQRVTRSHVLPFIMLQSLSPVSSLTAETPSQTPRSPQDRLLEALQGNRLYITMIDGRPVGPGWDFLVREARDARFTLVGEEHGVAETAQLSAALFTASDYSRLRGRAFAAHREGR